MMTYDPQVAQRNADWGASENVYDLATNLQISGCISQETRTMRSAHRYFIRLKRTYNGTDSGPPTPNTAKPQHLLRHCGLAAVYGTQKYSHVAVSKPACQQPPRRRHFCIEDLGVSDLPAHHLAVAISVSKSLLSS
jgi:hypothetical protein